MRLKCGQAEGQVNETATESLAVFDLPPLIQRDHLINWEDGMYVRIARGVSLLFPYCQPNHTPTPSEPRRGECFLCVCVCVCVSKWVRAGLLGGVSFQGVLLKANEGALVSTFWLQWRTTKTLPNLWKSKAFAHRPLFMFRSLCSSDMSTWLLPVAVFKLGRKFAITNSTNVWTQLEQLELEDSSCGEGTEAVERMSARICMNDKPSCFLPC